ncbi:MULTISPECIES: PAAR domain-containing protein [unclassified Pseudomonas]|uniref:PAAR domain-containing protein n=1 Tax=unclassified Pseudomonas TaxID=196821 RepID=UPI000BC8EC62|nr:MULTISPECIES: PAAR domain-containing protein [unclassified Pseudomonas]PVZ19631.1 putative Zn-binding protein involved in type VI secretion [Pseudomonas sp. URIL14HWK12:I12]PVZ22784.1 putative Zn-binding protein involved in type VI secretion [Pseudomonas sp. URIL14HWK12:I10]PVZ37586.1 putative Zn-binding protein involved in type VI secretion [Pseudomonas sp. URIL14HWK12:I11]SNZ15187.1 Zn-binding Pro-Ala-Ala-Arg (PAAR) domain-containing protein, incolved in TypeVI secretion [Pseudomonas sp. U
MSNSIIRQSDSLASGGKVLGGSASLRFGGLAVARVGDAVSCPIPGHGLNAIAQGDSGFTDAGLAVALHGHLCECGCSLVSSLPWAGRR